MGWVYFVHVAYFDLPFIDCSKKHKRTSGRNHFFKGSIFNHSIIEDNESFFFHS